MNTLLNKAAVAAMLIVLSSALSAAPSLLSPSDGAVGVSQSPALNAAELTPGASAQYHFQVNTVEDMAAPLFSFDQTVAQSFGGQGAFSGQNTFIVAGSSDAYSSVSTATFAYYSATAKLNPDTQYYWRTRAKPSDGVYGVWSGTASFTTGRFAAQSPVNHLAVSKANLYGATNTGLVNLGFIITENNVATGTSVNGGAYNTADWIFVKFSTQAGADGTWKHATLTGGSVDAGATVTAAIDKKGVFVNHTVPAAYWTAGATITWNFGADKVDGKNALVRVFAISMVRVPSGSFVYNAGNLGGTSDNNIAGPKTVSSNSGADLPAGAAALWPNGYDSFYIGRYEITDGQYADFLNTLWSVTAWGLDWVGQIYETPANPYGTRYDSYQRNQAASAISVSQTWSYLSWAGLRPPTEMEFEKAGRDLAPDARTYPWGNIEPDLVTYTPPNEGGTCIRRYMNYNNICGKALDVGRYMSGDVYRTAAETGVSPWGVADLAGNLAELVLNSSYPGAPANGSGTESWPSGWPAPGASGYGLRGGSWYRTIGFAEWYVSDRWQAGWPQTANFTYAGARVARKP